MVRGEIEPILDSLYSTSPAVQHALHHRHRQTLSWAFSLSSSSVHRSHYHLQTPRIVRCTLHRLRISMEKSDGGAAIQKKVNVAADALGMDDAVRKQVEVHQLIFAVVKKIRQRSCHVSS